MEPCQGVGLEQPAYSEREGSGLPRNPSRRAGDRGFRRDCPQGSRLVQGGRKGLFPRSLH